MQTPASRGLFLGNGRDCRGEPLSLRIAGARIAGVNVRARRGDVQIDLHGDRLLPGLINAHDHLQLNSLPRLSYRPDYRNVAQWIADIRPRLQSEPMFLDNRALPLQDRLFAGGLKNLLGGVTTVAHHDPFFPFLRSEVFPTRVLMKYGWSHSLPMDGAEAVSRAYRDTPPRWPWIIHAAEGIDEDAAAEFEQLERLGCIRTNTVLVHGLALSAHQLRRVEAGGAGLVWCPSSNVHLFGRTLDIRSLPPGLVWALGSDSRLSGEPDMLAELRVAREISGLDEAALTALLTEQPARLLRLPDRGMLREGALADVLVLPGDLPIWQARRADVRMVLLGGAMRYGDRDLAGVVEHGSGYARVRVDGRPKCLSRPLAARLSKASVQEAGLEVDGPAARPAEEVLIS